MKRAAHILLVIALLLASAMYAEAATAPKEVVAEVYPAPIGYTLMLQPPYPSRIVGFRDAGGNYYPYRASLSNNGLMILVDDINRFKTIVSLEGTSDVKIVNTFKYEVYGIIPDKGDPLVLFTGGELYTSSYFIYINSVPLDPSIFDVFQRRLVLIITEDSVDFQLADKYRYSLGLAVTSQGSFVSVYTKDGVLLSMRLSDLLGVNEACITWFSNLPPDVFWVGGVVLSPTCTSNINVLKTYVYNGRPYAVIFSLNSKYGYIDYVIMAKPVAAVLREAGIVTRVAVPKATHIVKGIDLSVRNVYVAATEQGYIMLGKELNVVNITQVVTANRGRTSNYVCMLPSGASVVFALAWRRINITGVSSLELLPGEVILIEAGGKYYLCHGDLSWLDSTDIPVVRASQFKEIKYPVQLVTFSGQPFLTVLANGKVYLSSVVTIDFDEYLQNEVFVYAAGLVQRITIVQTSIFMSPFFVISLLIASVFIGVIVFRGKESERDVVRIILDFPKPTPMKVSSESDIAEAAKKHVTMFGVCPDIYDIAIHHGLLPPLPEKVDPTQEVILCPFNTNPETESVLRYISSTLLSVLWVTKRTSPSSGYFYTVIGNTMLYMYFYKHEGEPVEKAIVNAIAEAMKIRIISPLYLMPLGLVIVTTESKMGEFMKELEYMKVLSTAAGEAVRSYAISSYVTVKGIPTKEPPDELQRFMNEKVPVILVVSRNNLGELLKFLEEKLTSYAKFYYEKLAGEKE